MISVIIATQGRDELALRALRSVVADRSADYEILIVDQARHGGLATLIGSAFDDTARIRYFVAEPRGLGYARNFGAARARGAILAFLDDDAVAAPGWLAAYAAAFEGPAAMVGGRIVPEWETALPGWYPPSRLFLLGLYDAGERMIPFPAGDLPSGANFAIRGDALARVEGFSEDLGFRTDSRWALAGEDSLVGARVRDAGMLLLYQPEALATHLIKHPKLQIGYFLRRHFVEGMTQIEVAVRTRARSRRWLVVAMIRYVADVMRAALDCLRSLGRGDSWWQSPTAFLGALFLSSGAVCRCVARLVDHTNSRRAR